MIQGGPRRGAQAGLCAVVGVRCSQCVGTNYSNLFVERQTYAHHLLTGTHTHTHTHSLCSLLTLAHTPYREVEKKKGLVSYVRWEDPGGRLARRGMWER